jgi:hypothetical protein
MAELKEKVKEKIDDIIKNPIKDGKIIKKVTKFTTSQGRKVELLFSGKVASEEELNKQISTMQAKNEMYIELCSFTSNEKIDSKIDNIYAHICKKTIQNTLYARLDVAMMLSQMLHHDIRIFQMYLDTNVKFMRYLDIVMHIFAMGPNVVNIITDDDKKIIEYNIMLISELIFPDKPFDRLTFLKEYINNTESFSRYMLIKLWSDFTTKAVLTFPQIKTYMRCMLMSLRITNFIGFFMNDEIAMCVNKNKNIKKFIWRKDTGPCYINDCCKPTDENRMYLEYIFIKDFLESVQGSIINANIKSAQKLFQ